MIFYLAILVRLFLRISDEDRPPGILEGESVRKDVRERYRGMKAEEICEPSQL
jgi:hypothetical protein